MATSTAPRPGRAGDDRSPAPARPPGRQRRRDGGLPYLLLLPAAAVLALVLGYPLVRLVLISFQDYGLRALFTGVVGWDGTANYAAVLDNPQLVPVLLRTIGFCTALVTGTLVIGMLVALMMGSLGARMRTAVTLCLIAAWAVPNVASTLVWQWLFQPVYGVVNWLLTQTHLFGDLTQHDWTSSTASAFALVWLLVVWQSVPFVALTLHAGLSQIPRTYYEAAALDGSGPWRTFRVITLPFLRPILGLVAILSVIWDFNVFNQIWILTQGGPGQGTTTLGIWSFTTAFSSNSFGQGAAIAVVSVLLLLVLTAVYVRRLVRSGEGPAIRRRALNCAAVLFCLVWAFPVYWMVNTAFKPAGGILSATPRFLPFPFTLANFADAVHKPGFVTDLENSAMVTCAVVLLSVLVAFFAAVALTRFRFPGRRGFLISVLVVQMIPQSALLIPVFLSLKSVDLLNNLFGLVLTYVAMVLPFTVWTLRGFLYGIPVELEEAAMLDGAGRMTIIRRVLLPLVMPGVIATSVFAFITAWNDYLFAYVLMKDQSHYTLPVWLVSFSTNTGTDYGGLIAASTLFALPVIVFFMLIQRRLVAGMTAGAVKD